MPSMLLALSEEERAEFWATLAFRHCAGFGIRTIYHILSEYGSAYEAFCRITDKNSLGLPGESVSALRSGVWRDSARAEWDSVASCEGRILLWTSSLYPEHLREIPDAPAMLYIRGDVSLLKNPSVAIVGTRVASVEGRRSARALAGGLSASGITVVSGMARGVDSEAHSAALSLPGGTIAVLGTGVDVAYPSMNKDLYENICREGLVLSEFSPGTPAMNRNFPIRNRIISGLSLGTLVIEAAPGSGSLITARLALEQNRAVYAVGGGVGEARFSGCQDLIRQGAIPVFSCEDILRDLRSLLEQSSPMAITFHTEKKSSSSVSRKKKQKDNTVRQKTLAFSQNAPSIMMSESIPHIQKPCSSHVKVSSDRQGGEKVVSERILAALASHGNMSIDDLCETLSAQPSEMASVLVLLEVDGLIQQTPDGRYSLI